MSRPPKLTEKQIDAAKMSRSRRLGAAWFASPEGIAAKAISDEFCAKWKAELAEIEGTK